MALPIKSELDRSLATVKELEESLASPATMMAMQAKLGPSLGRDFISFAAKRDLRALIKVFGISPKAQLKLSRSIEGRGTDAYVVEDVEQALLTAFSFHRTLTSHHTLATEQPDARQPGFLDG